MVSWRRCGVRCLGNNTVHCKKDESNGAMALLDYRMSHNRLHRSFRWLTLVLRVVLKEARYEKALVEHSVSPFSGHPRIPKIP